MPIAIQNATRSSRRWGIAVFVLLIGLHTHGGGIGGLFAAENQGGANVERANQLLRHAVFFKFKETSSAANVGQVVEAFRALPAQIPEILDFEWGVNTTPSERSDGFTHCFLLTFRNEQDRATYLPHPAHKAFGATLRPHLDRAFVVDFWGSAAPLDDKESLRHLVFLKFSTNAEEADRKAVEEAFTALPEKIDAIQAFEWGTNNSPEQLNEGYSHAFMLTFASQDELRRYAEHPAHQDFVAFAKRFVERFRVLDYIPQPSEAGSAPDAL